MTYKGPSAAQRKANKRYLTENVISVSTRLPKEKGAAVQDLAQQQGISVNSCINKLIDYGLDHVEEVFPPKDPEKTE